MGNDAFGVGNNADLDNTSVPREEQGVIEDIHTYNILKEGSGFVSWLTLFFMLQNG